MDLAGEGFSHVSTPATREFVARCTEADWAAAMAVLDEHWAEVWYAVDPADLRRLLSQVPPALLSSFEGANYIARTTGHGLLEDLQQPELAPGRSASVEEVAQFIGDLRLRGRPRQAMSHVRAVAERVQATRGRLVDGSHGRHAVWLVQAAITALLAGDVAAARGLLLQATSEHRVDRFPFVIREAMAKLALTYAASGQIAEAVAWADRARRRERGEAWVENLVDDSLWLTDYVCAVDRLDIARAEEMRLARPSPLEHLEFWGIALQAQVRHLALTDRPARATALCDEVAAAALPLAGSDGWLATMLDDARSSIASLGDAAAMTAQQSRHGAPELLASCLHLFTTGQFTAVCALVETGVPRSPDERPGLAVRLLEAQAATALGRAHGRPRLLDTLEDVFSQQALSALRYVTTQTLQAVRDTEIGSRAAELVEHSAIPTVDVVTVLEESLSEAETSVGRLLQQGLNRAEAADRLGVSVNTVKSQLRSLYRKLGVRDRAAALDKLGRLGL